MNRFRLLAILFVFAGCGAETPAEQTGTPVEEAANKPAIPIANKADLEKAVGSEVSVSGKVSRTGKSSSGHVFLNFASNPQFAVFIESKVASKFAGADPSNDFTGKVVTVKGKLERYAGKLQIRLASPDEISLEKASNKAAGKDDLPKPVELKQIGKDAWLSPAGLRYVGRDPEGRSRKEHVLRHANDIPNRDGPHGVFDGGAETAFAWIDEAWKLAKSKKLRPSTDDGRDIYTIAMGKRVGYLGGKTGAERGRPALTKIFIVLTKDTNEVITAYPK